MWDYPWPMAPATSFARSTKQPHAARGTSSKTPPLTAWRLSAVFIGGGGARSSLWLQIHADILKKTVHLTRESESCALGSAMAAAVAAGVYRDFDEAARAMVAIEKAVEPNPANAGVYDELFGNYVDLYKKLNAR